MADLLGGVDTTAAIETKPLIRALVFALLPSQVGAVMLGSLGVLSLALAAIGLYGVMSYGVARRTSEIAIRMSLGARPENILRLILKEGLTPAFLGALVGLLASWGLAGLVQQFLYGVKPLDALTFSVATLILVGVAALACITPARRATRVDPMVALRYE